MFSETSRGPPDRASTRFKRLRAGVIVLAALVILAIVSSSAYDCWRSYRYTLAATSREIGNMADALAEQTAWTLQAVDLLLVDTARWYRKDSEGMPAGQVNAILQNRAAGLPQVHQISIVDAQGLQRYGSRGSASSGHEVSDRSYFIAQRNGSANGLYMSEPIVTRSDGRVAIVLSRRLDDDRGHFAGVITAIVDLDDIKQFYTAINVGREARSTSSGTMGHSSYATRPPRKRWHTSFRHSLLPRASRQHDSSARSTVRRASLQ